MTSAATNTTEALLLNYALTTGSVTRPNAWYVALFTSTPGEAGGGTEVSGNGYARQAITFNAASTPSNGLTFCDNTATITFPTASGGNWGTITSIGIFSASTSGTLYFYGNLTTSKTCNDGDTFQFQAGSIVISLA